MRSAMMPRVDKSPSRQRENRSNKKPFKDSFVKQKLEQEKDKCAKEHQPSAHAMRRAPGFRIFQSPGRADADKVVRTQVAEVISQDDEKEEQAADHEPCTRDIPA